MLFRLKVKKYNSCHCVDTKKNGKNGTVSVLWTTLKITKSNSFRTDLKSCKCVKSSSLRTQFNTLRHIAYFYKDRLKVGKR